MIVRHDMIVCYIVRPDESLASHEFLQLRRVPGDFMGGTWQTVSGRIEEGEKAWQAALRELKEEAGLTPIEFYQLDYVETFYIAADDTLWQRPGFCAIVERDEAVKLNEEHDDFRWVAREKVDESFMWPGERAAIGELCREILDNGRAKPYLRIALPPAP
jgi:dATP pyrophosphohydrolase